MPNLIEVNPLPGLSPVSGDIVIMSRAAGWTYERLIGRIVSDALGRQGLLPSKTRSREMAASA